MSKTRANPWLRNLPWFAVALSVPWLGACALDLEESPAVGDDSTGEESQPLNEFSCTSNGAGLAQPDGAVRTAQFPHCSFADNAATSNDGTYDQPLCPNQFLTEVVQVNGRAFTAFVNAVPASPITSQSACQSILVNGAAWGFNGASWVSLGTVQSAGIWHPGGCGEIFCLPDECQLGFDIASASGYSKVRVAGFAAAFAIFKGRVRTGIRTGTGPC